MKHEVKSNEDGLMSTVSLAIELAKQKKEAFLIAEQEKKDSLDKKIRDMDEVMDSLCAEINKVMNEFFSKSEVRICGPSSSGFRSRREDPPAKTWAVVCDELPDGEIRATMRNDRSILIYGAAEGSWPTHHIYCRRNNETWDFQKVPYGIIDKSHKELTEETQQVSGIEQVMAIVLTDAINGMGNRRI